MNMRIPDVTDLSAAAQDYQRVAQAIQYLDGHFRDQPTLHEVAAHVHMSESHFQRLFKRWAGVSPKRFLQFLTKEYVKQSLERSRTLLEASYDVGLSGPGRLHDLLVTCEAVTPSEVRRRGLGLTIRYGFHPTPFGECLLGVTERGICWLSFAEKGGRQREMEELRESWCAATFQKDPDTTGALIRHVFLQDWGKDLPSLSLFVRGTNYQIKVWEALLRIPPGSVLTYGDVARWIGQPAAARAVGNAVARNLVSYLIPCHRVLRETGVVGRYRWGSNRKRALLAWEAVHRT